MIETEIRNAWRSAVEAGIPSADELARLVRSRGDASCVEFFSSNSDESTDVVSEGAGPLGAMRAAALRAARTGRLADLLTIVVGFARVGFVSPEASRPLYDAFAEGWMCGKANATHAPLEEDAGWRERADALLRAPGRLPDGVAEGFWRVVGAGLDPGNITSTIAAFAERFDDRMKEACARAILMHEGQRELAGRPWPARTNIESLSGYGPGTLGHAYYHLIVDNGFDPEVLDPDSVSGFHPGLDGTNRRILQQHELWHLVAGYSTSPLHETAISSFQLAQFGHNYSAMFLATATSLLLFTTPAFLDPILQVIAEGWQHGRRTRPLMNIAWEELWGTPIPEIRERFGVRPFESVIPDLMAA